MPIYGTPLYYFQCSSLPQQRRKPQTRSLVGFHCRKNHMTHVEYTRKQEATINIVRWYPRLYNLLCSLLTILNLETLIIFKSKLFRLQNTLRTLQEWNCILNAMLNHADGLGLTTSITPMWRRSEKLLLRVPILQYFPGFFMRKHCGLQEAEALFNRAFRIFTLPLWHPVLGWRFNLSGSSKSST